MPARLTAYLPDDAAPTRLLVEGDVLRIGRDAACGLHVAHPSVSRVHAQLAFADGAWRITDLDSKNGIHLDGAPVRDAALARDGWLRLGDIYCEFALVADDSVAAEHDRRRAQRTRATALTQGLQRAPGFERLLDDTLRAAIELAHCRRGFLLLRSAGVGDDFSVRASHAFDPGALGSRRFTGSVGAVQRTLRERRAFVANDVGSEAWLATRASVVVGGLHALACLPLLDGAEAIGAVYVDRDVPGEAITTLDLELLQAFTERAALYIVARRESDAASVGASTPAAADARWSRIVAAHDAAPDVAPASAR